MERDFLSKFEQEMRRLYEEPKAKYGYDATYFRQMLHEHGAFEAAVRLASDPRHHDGLTRLWQLGALDLSVEALVCRKPWRQHFDAEVLSTAKKKLDALGHKYSEQELEA